MRRITMFAVALLLCSASLFAQTSAPAPAQLQPVPEMQRASMDEVHALFESIGSKQQVQQIVRSMQTQMAKAVEEQLKKQSPPPTPKQIEHAKAFLQETINTMNLDEMLDDMAVIYQKYITRDEIVAIRAFYDSPAGKSMIAKVPGIMTEYMQVALPKQMKKMETAMASLQERIQKDTAEDSKPATHKQ